MDKAINTTSTGPGPAVVVPSAPSPIDFDNLDAVTIAALAFADRTPFRTTAVFFQDQVQAIEALVGVKRNRFNSPDSRRFTAGLQAVIDLGLAQAKRLGYIPGAPVAVAEEMAEPVAEPEPIEA